MWRSMLAGVVFGGLAFHAHSAEPMAAAGKPEVNLQGVWTLVKVWDDGVRVDQEELAGRTIEIAKDQLRFVGREGDGPEVCPQGTFKLDPAHQPGWIDWTVDKDKPASLGIYELKGDTLRLCFARNGDRRPTEFVSLDRSEVLLLELQRQPIPAKAN